ncbi:hypothetical protein FHX74_001246 [Friedmanniella endophytica]|uniref:Uncharacterized protein n=1 Tax=Microlunatus kandeliicorticis TaxID=1759536 RepID=A0A7W3IR09_9ACTN|nr:DUF6177 family protein [Microlunatus kandeliicorticis]MBA8793641.1 hypothetical protein [Microlunatus kandeliicorticis]
MSEHPPAGDAAGSDRSDRPELEPTDFRDVPVTEVGHPLADRIGPEPAVGPDPDDAPRTDRFGWVVTETRSRIVRLSPLRLNFLAMCQRDRRVPVLVSDELSRLTLPFTRIWRLAGGTWVVREADGGLRNGFDGRRLDRIEDVWSRPAPTGIDEFAVGHLRPVRTDALQLTVIVALRHPARSSTRLGVAATRITEAVLGRPPEAWGPSEPASAPWDPDELTALVREEMPGEASVVLAGAGVTGTLSGQRTSNGVEELLHLTLAITDPTPDRIAAAREALDAALQHLAETAMPLIAVAMARPGPADLLLDPRLAPPPIPLTLLIGAPAVRGFALDPALMAERYGARTVGRPRIPALLVDLGALEPEAWLRLDAVLGAFPRAELDEVLGLGVDGLRAAQVERPVPGPGAPDLTQTDRTGGEPGAQP